MVLRELLIEVVAVEVVDGLPLEQLEVVVDQVLW
jgi:hypothetical protein